MNRVIHFNIQADNFERAKKFYEDVLGWKFEQVMTKEESGKMDYWLIHTGTGNGIDGGISIRPENKPKDTLFNYECTIEVDNIDRVLKAIKENGGQVLME